MRNRIIEKKVEIERIISECNVCYIGMVDKENKPYVLPFNFGYKDDVLYFHSSGTGKKIEILKHNSDVCAVFSLDHELKFVNEEVACSYGMKYRSVLAHGKVEFIEDYNQKVEALQIIMHNYSDIDFKYNKPAVEGVCVWKVKVEKFEGKALE